MPSPITRLLLSASILCITASSVAAQEKVTFPSADGDLRGGTPTALTGMLYKPEGPGPFPAVVVLHGCNGLFTKEGGVIPLYGHWGDNLSREGYVVLMPDSHGPRGHGDICGVPLAEWPVKSNRERPRDAFGALSYLQSRPDVRGDQAAILGQSAGGTAMFWTITQDARPADTPHQQDFRAAVALYPGCQPFLSREPHWAPRQPLLLLMGEADNFTPAAPCKQIVGQAEARGAPIETHFYPDTYHAFDHPNLPVRVLTHVKLPPDGHSPIVGTNPVARADAIERVKRFFAARLKQQ